MLSHIQQQLKLAVDAVVFGYDGQHLRILLIRQKFGVLKDRWALPGGFVLDTETLGEAVARELLEETGVKTNYLEQLYTFGDQLDRDPRGRVVSVAYFGLVRPEKLRLKATGDAAEARWYSLNELPELAFDHGNIIEVALARLRAKLYYQPVGFELLKRNFPFSDLENLYVALLGREIDRRNFRKKMLSLGILTETGEKIKLGPGRPASLYRFVRSKYRALERSQSGFSINLGTSGK